MKRIILNIDMTSYFEVTLSESKTFTQDDANVWYRESNNNVFVALDSLKYSILPEALAVIGANLNGVFPSFSVPLEGIGSLIYPFDATNYNIETFTYFHLFSTPESYGSYETWLYKSESDCHYTLEITKEDILIVRKRVCYSTLHEWYKTLSKLSLTLENNG